MPQVETLCQAPGQKLIGLERDCAGEGLLGRRQDGGKGTKKDGNGVDGLLSQPRQDFTGCLQCSCPSTMKAVLGVGTAEVGPFKFLATVWPHAMEAHTRSSAPSLKHCCLLLPPRLCLERLRCSRHGHGSMASPSPPPGVPLPVHHPVEGTPAGRCAVPCPGASLHHRIPWETPQ